ncbi:MAG TPA: ComF family protein [Usitatibacter sp.]|nr:ComF family protein [Usitatibacter sp.]
MAAWPQDCVLCLAPAGDALCGACAAALPWLDRACTRCAVPLPNGGMCVACVVRAPAFDAARSCFEYRFPLDRLVQRFKFAADLALGRWLAACMARVLCDERADLLLVPPLARSRLRERGFNQALELAKTLSRALDVPCRGEGLVRIRETQPQPGLDRAERARNLRGAFRCEASVAGLHVALVDDVMTTGATAQEIACVLRDRGAARVSVWTVARTPAPA